MRDGDKSPEIRRKKLGDCANFLSPAQVDGDQLANTAFGHRYTIESVHSGHGHTVMGNNQEARGADLRDVVEKVTEPVYIGVIKRGVDLIEHADTQIAKLQDIQERMQ